MSRMVVRGIRLETEPVTEMIQIKTVGCSSVENLGERKNHNSAKFQWVDRGQWVVSFQRMPGL